MPPRPSSRSIVKPGMRQVLRVHFNATRARRSHAGETVQDFLASPATVDVGVEGAVGRAFR